MKLYLVNPRNRLVSIAKVKESRWNRFRVWKPLGLMVLAGLTPREWEVTIVDENLGAPDYSALPRPDLVGITAFTSQANRAYEISDLFRRLGVPVVMGGIHATLCLDEVLERTDAVVTGEAEGIWARVLEDVRAGRLRRHYKGGRAKVDEFRSARHDLLAGEFALGSIQTSRGCPLNCNFCSVTAFNGSRFRQRPIEDVVREFQSIPEKRVLVVDDNLIGTNPRHIAHAKNLFRAMARAKVDKEWIGQTTINFADDDELIALAARAGCQGVFIGFESPTPEGLRGVGSKYQLFKDRDFRTSVRRIQRHRIFVIGSFILGLDDDGPGVGRRIAEAAREYGLDSLNVLYMTPLPGTRLWDDMAAEDRIALNTFPADWQYFTLTLPVTRFRQLSLHEAIAEMHSVENTFYSLSWIFRRVCRSIRSRRQPLISLIGNISYRNNIRLNRSIAEDLVRNLEHKHRRCAMT